MKKSSTEKFLIAGIARNCGQTSKNEIMYLQNAMGAFKNKQWLVIESDSDDNTVEQLKELEGLVENFRYISLGTLRNRYPLRTQRIAYCRNKYLEELENNPDYSDVQYLVVADLDGVNSCITAKAIESCWSKSDWTVCTANQWGPYYDVFALRHEIWSPNNCWDAQRFLGQHGMKEEDSTACAVYSRMIEIGEGDEWIEVDSAFGGLGIYKIDGMKGIRYHGLNDRGEELCEHVPFHKAIKGQGGKIFINPMLINAELTDHSRVYREWKAKSKA